MGELLTARTQLEALIADRDSAIAKVQAVYEKPIGVARGWAATAAAGLEAYYYAHLAEMEDGGARKHCKLANGVMGRRFGPGKLAPLNRSWTWASIETKVRELFGMKFFRAAEPELDKQALKEKLDAEKLAAVGLKTKNDETFYAEPDRPEEPDAPGGSR
jgi:hypothetical protein